MISYQNGVTGVKQAIDPKNFIIPASRFSGSPGIRRHYTPHPFHTTPLKTSAAIPFDTATGLAALSKHGIGVIWMCEAAAKRNYRNNMLAILNITGNKKPAIVANAATTVNQKITSARLMEASISSAQSASLLMMSCSSSITGASES